MKTLRHGLALTIGFLLLGPLASVATAQGGKGQTDETKVIDFEEMRYPIGARLSHTEGLVVLRVKLDKDGNVVEAEALSGPRTLISDCLKNVKTWRFQPNSSQTAIVVYHFRIEGLCHGDNSSQFIFYPPNFARITSCDAHVEP